MGKVDFVRAWMRKLRNPVFLDYPIHPSPRWGWGKPEHPGLLKRVDSSFDRCLELIDGWKGSGPLEGIDFWENAWISPVDGLSLMSMIRKFKPKTYLEVGSGVSTRFVRHAVGAWNTGTRIMSIDPQPRVEIDRLCDEVIRKPFEECDLEIFRRLEPGDVVFIDNSHRVFQNSDVTVFFLEALPALRPGVIVGIHDIYLPSDYPPEWLDRFYSEQYLLAAWLLANPTRPRVLWPVFHSCQRPDSKDQLRGVLAALKLQGNLATPFGGAFWLET